MELSESPDPLANDTSAGAVAESLGPERLLFSHIGHSVEHFGGRPVAYGLMGPRACCACTASPGPGPCR